MAQQIPLTRRALVARLRRHMSVNGEKLCASRSEGGRDSVGDYYIVGKGGVVRTHVDIVELAKKLKLMKAYEALTD